MSFSFSFFKMHGAGNDFIMTSGFPFHLTAAEIAALCDRRRGIGADGLIHLTKMEDGRIRFSYYNADGSPAEMCGNGLRCAMEYSALNGLAGKEADFVTDSGTLHAERLAPELIRIRMPDALPVREFVIGGRKCCFTAVGVPHAVVPLASRKELEEIDVFGLGRSLRYAAEFAPAGANVDFIAGEGKNLYIRTYERGVEDETLACGTGASASAVVHAFLTGITEKKHLICRSGDVLTLELTDSGSILSGIYLTGPAKTAFRGTV